MIFLQKKRQWCIEWHFW